MAALTTELARDVRTCTKKRNVLRLIRKGLSMLSEAMQNPVLETLQRVGSDVSSIQRLLGDVRPLETFFSLLIEEI